MKRALGILGLVLSAGGAAMGQTVPISSFSGNGTLTWAYPADGVTGYRVEWASQAGGPWTDFAGAAARLDGIAPTGDTMTVAVPMFYRVVAELADYLVVDLSGGPTASAYPVSHLTNAPAGGWTDEFKTTKLVLRRIPVAGGAFAMGSPADELGREPVYPGSETSHPVTLTQPCYVGVFEVTQKQWERVMGTWPGYFRNAGYRDTRPVENVSHNEVRGAGAGAGWPASDGVDTNSFMGRLRARTGRAFDLPTESQWEYAGRAGTVTALNVGHNLTNTITDAHLSAAGRYWGNGGSLAARDGDTSGATAGVGSYQPNAWGLYDIHGNVYEWCLDWYGTYPGSVSDPTGPASGTYRVLRGGSWGDAAGLCRTANRGYGLPGEWSSVSGFRAALGGTAFPPSVAGP